MGWPSLSSSEVEIRFDGAPWGRKRNCDRRIIGGAADSPRRQSEHVMVTTPWLSVVIPVFNEAESLAPLWTELRPALDDWGDHMK